MSKRYVCGMGFTSEDKPIRIIHDKVEDKDYYLFADLCKIMNEQQATISRLEEENEQLRTQLAICQQSKNDNGGFQVWQVPPIKKGMRITTSTTSDGEKDE